MWNKQALIRLTPLVRSLHRLGERPLLEFMLELSAGDKALADDIEQQLARYSRLDPAMVEALDARELRPPLATVEGGRR